MYKASNIYLDYFSDDMLSAEQYFHHFKFIYRFYEIKLNIFAISRRGILHLKQTLSKEVSNLS